MRRRKRKRLRQSRGLLYFRKKRPTGLLAGLQRDPPPAVDSLMRGAFQATLGPRRLHRDDFRDTQLRGLLDHPFEMVELDERRAKDQRGSRRRRGELFEGAKRHVLFARRLDL